MNYTDMCEYIQILITKKKHIKGIYFEQLKWWNVNNLLAIIINIEVLQVQSQIQ